MRPSRTTKFMELLPPPHSRCAPVEQTTSPLISSITISNPSRTSDCATNDPGHWSGAASSYRHDRISNPKPPRRSIVDPNVQPGKTLTLYANGGSFSLVPAERTGNEYPINLGSFASPLVVTSGNTVVLALLDQGSFPCTVVSGTSRPEVVNGTTTVGTSTISASTCGIGPLF